MDRATLSRAVNGGYIEKYDFDMHRNRLYMRVDVLDSGVLSTHELGFEKISRFVFETESHSEAGDRLELTEISIDGAPETSSSEEWDATISIFDMSHIRIRCSVITLDGEALR